MELLMMVVHPTATKDYLAVWRLSGVNASKEITPDNVRAAALKYKDEASGDAKKVIDVVADIEGAESEVLGAGVLFTPQAVKGIAESHLKERTDYKECVVVDYCSSTLLWGKDGEWETMPLFTDNAGNVDDALDTPLAELLERVEVSDLTAFTGADAAERTERSVKRHWPYVLNVKVREVPDGELTDLRKAFKGLHLLDIAVETGDVHLLVPNCKDVRGEEAQRYLWRKQMARAIYAFERDKDAHKKLQAGQEKVLIHYGESANTVCVAIAREALKRELTIDGEPEKGATKHVYTADDIAITRYGERGWEWSYFDIGEGKHLVQRTGQNGEGIFVLKQSAWCLLRDAVDFKAPATEEEMLAYILRSLNS